MWVVFDDAPLPGATPLTLYDHGRWDARLLAARGEVICVCFDEAEYPLVFARPGRLPAATIARWADTLRRMGHDHVLLELKQGQPQVAALNDASKLLASRTAPVPPGAPAPVMALVVPIK